MARSTSRSSSGRAKRVARNASSRSDLSGGRSRRKPPQALPAKPTLLQRLSAGWVDEALAFFLSSVALFLFFSFVSHQLVGPQYFLSPELGEYHTTWNLMGPVGHVASTVGVGLLGWTALVPIGWLFALSYLLWTFDERVGELQAYPVVIVLLGAVGATATTAALAALTMGPLAGGEVGLALSIPVISMVGNLGGAILFSALCIVFLALSLRLTLEQFGLGVRKLVFSSLVFSFAAVRLVICGVWSCCCFVFGGAFNALCSILSGCMALLRTVFTRGEASSKEERSEAFSKRSRSPGHPTVDSSPEEESELEAPLVVRTELAEEARRARKKRSEGVRRRSIHPAHESNPKFEDYQAPSAELLIKGEQEFSVDEEELKKKSSLITAKLADFNVKGRVTHVHPGPVITMFEFAPAAGVKVNRISALQDDLAMSLKANSIRIIAPIPGRGTVGIEVPNRDHETVRLRDLLESSEVLEAESSLSIPLGKSIFGRPVVEDIATMPHLLMAGATGTGKSVCINAILLSLLYRAHPSELGLILIDPKILELSIYEGVPHLRVPVVTEPRRAKAVLQWAVQEMDRRYRMMQKYGVRSIDSFNAMVAGELPLDSEPVEEPSPETIELSANEQQATEGKQLEFHEFLEPLPKIVIVIDELADLILTAGKQLEELITRLAQKARAAGIHLILATQRPSVDVITGLIKANFPARLSFRVSSRIDSRTILDAGGAERLLGRGDMLFLKPGAARLTRVHGSFVTDDEVRKVTDFLRQSANPVYDQRILDMCERAEEEENQSGGGGDGGDDSYDALYDEALELVLQKGQASTSMVQRAFRIGYNRAARIIDMMEREGVVGPMDGAKPRRVILEGGASE